MTLAGVIPGMSALSFVLCINRSRMSYPVCFPTRLNSTPPKYKIVVFRNLHTKHIVLLFGLRAVTEHVFSFISKSSWPIGQRAELTQLPTFTLQGKDALSKVAKKHPAKRRANTHII